MTRTRWIVFVVFCALVLGGLVYVSKKDSVDVSSVDTTKIATTTESAIGDHVFGNKDAKVMLIEYGDFQCPACGAAYPQIKTIKEKYKDSVVFLFRNFPLTTLHPNALAAASVAEAAGLQGKYWEMHNKLYESQDSWSNAAPDQRDSIFESYASELGLNMDQFRSDRSSKKVSEKISRDQALGRKAKVDGTPGIFINDTKVSNETTSDLMQKQGSLLMSQLDAAIKKAGDTPPANN